MTTNDIQNAVQQAILAMFSAAIPRAGSGENFERDRDRDPWKTGFPRFSSADSNVDIFTFLSRFDTTVSTLHLSEEDKKKVLIDRISFSDRQRLSQLDSTEFNYPEWKEKIGELLSTPELGKQFEKYFSNMKMPVAGKVYDHFLKASEKWDGFVSWRAASNKSPPEDQTFLDKFEESVPQNIRSSIIEQRIRGKIFDIQTLGMYIDTYKSIWLAPEGELTNTKILSTQLTTLQQQNESLREALNLVVREQKEARSIAEAAKNLTQITSDSNSKLADQVSRQAANRQGQLNQLEQATRGVQDTINTEKYVTQRSFLDFQRQDRLSGFHLNNVNAPNFHRDRQSNDSGWRGRDRNSFSPGRRSPDNRGYSSGESRSPSPNPVDNLCFACLGNHWMIKCPYLARVEKENELYKLLAKKIKSGRSRANEEELLRTEYQVPKNPKSQLHTNTVNRKLPPAGQGPYCKWCHVKGHATIVCVSFCPLCEMNGHGWRECKEATHSALITQRNTSFQANIAKAERASYKN